MMFLSFPPLRVEPPSGAAAIQIVRVSAALYIIHFRG